MVKKRETKKHKEMFVKKEYSKTFGLGVGVALHPNR
jgi:hypothetical protein